MNIKLVFFAVIFGTFATHSLAAETTKDPEEFVSLRESWQKARKQATDPIDSKYLIALNKMKARFATSDRLDDAIIIDKEIKCIKENLETPHDHKQSLISEIEGTEWQDIRSPGLFMHFKDKKLFWGSIQQGQSKTPMNAWVLVKENDLELSFKYRSGAIAVLKFDKDRKSFFSSDGDRTMEKIIKKEE